jgi:hypothetical protein
MIYTYSVAGVAGSIQAPNWKTACEKIKAANPNCGYIKFGSSIKEELPPYSSAEDDNYTGDFDDAGRIGKDSPEWRNRKRGTGVSYDWGYIRRGRSGKTYRI